MKGRVFVLRRVRKCFGLFSLALLCPCASTLDTPGNVARFTPVPAESTPDTPESWYHGRMEIRPATDPLFREVYGEFAPTMKSILPHDFGRILRNPDSIMLFGARHMMSEEVEKLDDLTLLGYAVATGNGVRLDNDSAQKLVHALQQLENFGDNFLGVTSADFGLKFIRGTNTLDIIFELVTPSVTIASQARRHNDRRAASPTLMAVACKLAEAHLFEDQHLQRKIEIFRSSNKFLDTLSEPARDARGPRNGSE